MVVVGGYEGNSPLPLHIPRNVLLSGILPVGMEVSFPTVVGDKKGPARADQRGSV